MKSKNKYLRFKRVLGDWRVFAGILVLFGASSVAIAATADFPLPYDEQYHFALIQHYSHQLSPFITVQPAELGMTGDATRLGSYLSHYLLSFPLRATTLFTNDVSTQVVLLRLINIGFVMGALILFRQFALRLMRSGVAANGAVALLCALPVTSLLAAHINYDNLLLLVFAALLVMAQRALRQMKTNQNVNATLFLGFVAIALLGCLVKFTFLPIAAVMLALVVAVVFWSRTWPTFKSTRSYWGKILLGMSVVLSLVATGLFAERYVGNVVAYGSLQPDCAAVQPLSVCLQHGAWSRNYSLLQTAVSDTKFEGRSIEGYVVNVWAPLMIRGLGGVNNQGIVTEIPKPVLVGLMAVVSVLGIGVLTAVVMYRKDPLVLIIVFAIGVYGVALLQRNYSEFMSLHEIVAVQGRYAVPFLIPLFVVGLLGLKLQFQAIRELKPKIFAWVELLGDMEHREAYNYSTNYWSNKFRRTDQIEG